jgi:DNA-binding transcriptional MerR regulator
VEAERKLYYKIGEACRVLDIQPYVLRYWETEFPVLQPIKSRSGQRVYSERELVVIRRIKELLYDEGYTIAGAKKKLETEGLASPAEESDEDNNTETKAPSEAAVKKPARRKKQAPAALPAPTGVVLPFEASPADRGFRAPAPVDARLRRGLKAALAEARALLERIDRHR